MAANLQWKFDDAAQIKYIHIEFVSESDEVHNNHKYMP